MPSVQSSPRRLERRDLWLFALALLGLAVYVGWLPELHPDAAADFRLREGGAIEAANTVLARHGYAVEGLDATARLRRNPALMDSLHTALGRAQALEVLDSEVVEQLPVFFWQVDYRRPPDRSEPPGRRYQYRVYLTQSGNLWALANQSEPPRTRAEIEESLGQRVNRTALRAAFEEAADEALPDTALVGLTDTTLVQGLRFGFGALETEASGTFEGGGALRALRSGAAVPAFGEASAIALARYHLRRTPLPVEDLTPDSTWVLAERADRVARVRFVTTEPFYGQRLLAEVQVSAVGGLQELSVQFNGSSLAPEPGPSRTFSVELLQWLTILFLVLMLLVAFIGQLVKRQLDVRAALIDALVIGGLAAVALLLATVQGLRMLWEWEPEYLGSLLLTMSLGGGMAGTFALIAFIATDSPARSVWAQKVLTASLIRQGIFRNRYVGAALVRGVALAFVLLGLLVTLLLVFPQAAFQISAVDLLSQRWPQPMTGVAAQFGASMYLFSVALLLGAGTWVYRWSGRTWLVVVVAGIIGALISLSPVGIQPLPYQLGFGAALAAVAAVAFLRYDFVTAFVGSWLAASVLVLSEGWLIPESPAWVDVMLVGLLVTGLLVLGFTGVLRPRRGREIAEYTPPYIEEITQQERIRRELELAHQVQETFLPRRTPHIDGLELAAMCLAAQEVGGDYFDFIELEEGRLGVVIGDVSGKGIQAAFYMTLAKGLLQSLSRLDLGPADVLRRLNALFWENAPRGMFISMIYGVMDVREGSFTFARAGHNPVIIQRDPSDEPRMLQPPGMAIGLDAGERFDGYIEEVRLDLRPGDVLVLYTDGFSEAMNRKQELYGDDRLARKVGEVGQRTAAEVLRSVTEDVHHFVEAVGRHDDMTMIVLKLAPQRPVQPAAARRALAKPS